MSVLHEQFIAAVRGQYEIDKSPEVKPMLELLAAGFSNEQIDVLVPMLRAIAAKHNDYCDRLEAEKRKR